LSYLCKDLVRCASSVGRALGPGLSWIRARVRSKSKTEKLRRRPRVLILARVCYDDEASSVYWAYLTYRLPLEGGPS